MIGRTILIAATTAVALAGCGSTNEQPVVDQAGQVVQPEASETSIAAPTTPAPTTTAAKPTPKVGLCPANPPKNGPLTDQGEDVGRVGASSYTYKSSTDEGKAGICVAVLKVERVTFGEYAAGADRTARKGVAVTVQVVNNESAVFDLNTFSVVVAAGAAGTELEAVFDSQSGYSGGFSGSVAPKRRATGKFAFGLAKPASLSIQVKPGFAFEDTAIFESKPV